MDRGEVSGSFQGPAPAPHAGVMRLWAERGAWLSIKPDFQASDRGPPVTNEDTVPALALSCSLPDTVESSCSFRPCGYFFREFGFRSGLTVFREPTQRVFSVNDGLCCKYRDLIQVLDALWKGPECWNNAGRDTSKYTPCCMDPGVGSPRTRQDR